MNKIYIRKEGEKLLLQGTATACSCTTNKDEFYTVSHTRTQDIIQALEGLKDKYRKSKKIRWDQHINDLSQIIQKLKGR